MNVGMMWLDADAKRPFAEKVQRAAEYYKEKYGRFPTCCYVNKAALDGETKVGKILIKPINAMLPNHFWLGIEPS